jgi:hypothetical protein
MTTEVDGINFKNIPADQKLVTNVLFTPSTKHLVDLQTE